MSAPEVMNKAKEKQDEILSEKDNEKTIPTIKSQTFSRERKRKIEVNDKSHTQIKYSQTKEHCSDANSPKRIGYDAEQNVNNTSADLTTSNSEKTKESSSKEEHIENSLLVVQHYNSVLNKDRNKSRILYMRNFNNWIKSMLILEFINKTPTNARLKVLDMCCGKGGDLFKWEKMNAAHLICTDLADVTMQQCQDRYKQMSKRYSQERRYFPIFSAEFITADCTKVQLRTKFKDPSISLDLVSCQFAFHYCFESLQQAECMFRNASECLKPGGYFIGTIPNAYDLVSRWQKCDGDSFGNDIYSVEFFCDKTKPPLFGAKYHFQLEGVVNCPEFLVYLPVFRKLASKFDLNLVLFERFDNFYERMKDGDKGRMLLSKIQSLETYPPRREVRLTGNPDKDYQHAKEYCSQKTSTRCEIGTLSQTEWEVTSLYAVFSFEKMKPGWKQH
ncbi:RNA guanine-7 methyltransferase [Bombus vancouverensis nearcticus]|uniref:mRNA cap guanine-N7 methyltransferase n=1 Tax=Bombus vancouverensis nearcticus TaxID=2705178 RepID=UPI00143BC365|nr:mRNA cap guanine-N7 methyltransferase [Bombus vancouverensis nearcticus]XP_033189951.1 mRNA cap guanine-N7 methyltransferase [Bombus vancouverensis nearcticus]